MREIKNFNQNIISIDVLMYGGLGNQIFQYLAGRFISNELDCDSIKFSYVGSEYPAIKKLINCAEIKNMPGLKLKENSYKKNKIISKSRFIVNKLDQYLQYKFGISLLSNNLILKEIMSPKINYDLMESINHSKNILIRNKKKFVIKMDGFWQDPMQYKDKLEFLSNEFSARLLPFHNTNTFTANSYITIHARRGDYINNPDNAKEYFSNYSLINFIMASLSIIPSDLDDYPVLLITDDIEWFQKFSLDRLSNFKREINICEGNEISHWNLINNARLNIISNSTFSFTAALLNKKNINEKLRIIMPFWYNNKKNMLEKGWTKVQGAVAI